MSNWLFTYYTKIKALLEHNHFSPYIADKMLWTSGIEWSEDMSKLDEADFIRYDCSKNECYMLGELKNFVADYVQKHPNSGKPVERPAPEKPSPQGKPKPSRSRQPRHIPADDGKISRKLAELNALL
jgi:hypothetical protein